MKTLEKVPIKVAFTIDAGHVLTDRQLDLRIAKLAELELEVKRLKAEADALKAEIIEGLPEERHATKKWKLNYSIFSRKTIDSKQLRLEMPDIAEKYTRETISHRFSYSAI